MNAKKLAYTLAKGEYGRWYADHVDNRMGYEAQTEAFNHLHKALLAQDSIDDYVRDLENLVMRAYYLVQFGKAASWADDNDPAKPFWDDFRETIDNDTIDQWDRQWQHNR